MADLSRPVLVKFSGEVLRSSPEKIYTKLGVERIVQTLLSLYESEIPFGVVIGAGNILRGATSAEIGIDRLVGDQAGMLATVINAMIVRDALAHQGIQAHVMAPFSPLPSICQYNPQKARECIARREPVLFAGGTGNAFVTTDSAAVLRSLDIGARLLIKATKVPGVFSEDPLINPKAVRFDRLTHAEALRLHVNVMDQTAITLAHEYGLPIFVYKFGEPVSLPQALQMKGVGTYIESEKESHGT
jgi:uridylate kinase